MDERTVKECSYDRYDPKSYKSVLGESSYQFMKECFSPFTPSFLQAKIKSCKSNSTQCFKQFERCEYKTTCRPPIQLFKTNQDCKVLKTEENAVQTQKKQLKINKTVNKIFQHNPTDSESLKIYRDLYIYKSLGSVSRKNLERAIEVYNANRDEIEMTKRFTTRRNSSNYKREQSHHKKVIKNEPYCQTIKPKNEVKEKLKEFQYFHHGTIVNQNKTQQSLDNDSTVCKKIVKLNKTAESSRVPKNELKKIIIKNDVKRILPQLPIRPIARKIKEKKQLTLAVLNISLPSLDRMKKGTLCNLKPKIYKNSMENIITKDYNKNDILLDNKDEIDDDFYILSNRKKTVYDIRNKLFPPNKNNMSNKKKKGYLLNLPIDENNGKGLTINSRSFSLLTLPESTTTSSLPSPINDNLAMLPQQIGREQNPCRMMGKSPSISNYEQVRTNLWNIKMKKELAKEISFEKHKRIGTCEFINIFRARDQEHCHETKSHYSKLRQIILNSHKSVDNGMANTY